MTASLRPARSGHLALEDGLLLALVTMSFLLALTGFNHFGASWDEDIDSRYARLALSAYHGKEPDWASLGADDFLELHGPAYLMGSELVAGWLARVRPDWTGADAHHFTNHLMLLAAVGLVYLLGRRLGSKRIGLLGGSLMLAQPLVLGHSFINQKDIPFMAVFLAAVVLGLRANDALGIARVDAADARDDSARSPGLRPKLTADWRSAGRRRRIVFCLVAGASVILIIELFWLRSLVLPSIHSAVVSAYHGRSLPFLNDLFARLAENANRLPVGAYLEKADRLYAWFRFLPVPLACLSVIIVGLPVFPSLAAAGRSIRWRDLLTGFKRPPVFTILPAGGLLGLTISTRSPGVFAGVLVTGLLLRRPSRAWMSIILYWAIALLVCIATWPYLWSDPLAHFAESLRSMSAFPWGGDILYAGRLWDAGATPWPYLPFLFLAQLTLPTVVAFAVGVGVAASRRLRPPLDRSLVFLLIVWLCFPIAAAVALRSTVYDNTRQFLFVVPPVFALAGLGLDRIMQRLNRLPAQLAIVAVVLAPGLLAIARLHPYEYTYYNELVGGTLGAFRNYETDYWCTSYRRAMERVNESAPEGASVGVWGPVAAAAEFARPDLSIHALGSEEPEVGRPDFGLVCSRSNMDQRLYPDSTIVWEVETEGAVLAVVKDLRKR